AHEHKAAAMAPTSTYPDPAAAADVGPVIDAALMRLGTIDRSIVTLHFLKEQSVEEVAAAVGSTVAAVRKRVARALPKRRDVLSRNGVLLSAGALPVMLQSFKPEPGAMPIDILASNVLAIARGGAAPATVGAQ